MIHRILKAIRQKLIWSYVKHFLLRVRSNEWCFIPIYGIGDAYMILSLLTAFRQQNKGVKKIKIVLINQKHVGLLYLFPDTFDDAILIDARWLNYIPVENALTKGRVIIFSCWYFFPNALKSLLGHKKITINEIYKLMLNVFVTTINEKPVVSPEIKKAGIDRFNTYGFEQNRTVLIAPHANTVDAESVPFSFWEEIIGFLSENEYHVAVLSNEEKYLLSNWAKHVFFPLDEAIPFCEQCGFVISVRSGLCDLLSTANCEKFILYPKFQPGVKNIAQWSSLIEMGLCNEKINELIYDENNIGEIINTIKNKLKNGKIV